MRIAVCILYSKSWKEIVDIISPNVHIYCDGNNYDSYIIEYPTEFSGFEKVKWCKKLLKEYDAVWSLDADTIITNHHIKIERFINYGQDLFITKDYNNINAGSFIICRSEWSDSFLDYLLLKSGDERVHCEQDAIVAYIKEFPNNDKIKILPHPSINSYLYENYPEIPPQTHKQGQWEEGDFILHLPGVGIEQRKKILSHTKVTL